MNERERWLPDEYKSDWRYVLGILSQWFAQCIFSFIEINGRPTVLEVGTGSGKWAAAFAIMNCRVTTVDILPEMLKRARNNFPNFKITYICDDVRTLFKIKDNSYDIVFSEGLVEHFLDHKERKKVLQNLLNKVKSGVLIFIVPITDEDDEHHYNSITAIESEIEDLIGCSTYKVAYVDGGLSTASGRQLRYYIAFVLKNSFQSPFVSMKYDTNNNMNPTM